MLVYGCVYVFVLVRPQSKSDLRFRLATFAYECAPVQSIDGRCTSNRYGGPMPEASLPWNDFTRLRNPGRMGGSRTPLVVGGNTDTTSGNCWDVTKVKPCFDAIDSTHHFLCYGAALACSASRWYVIHRWLAGKTLTLCVRTNEHRTIPGPWYGKTGLFPPRPWVFRGCLIVLSTFDIVTRACAVCCWFFSTGGPSAFPLRGGSGYMWVTFPVCGKSLASSRYYPTAITWN